LADTPTDIPPVAQRAREMYAAGAATRAILAETGLSLHAFYNWLDGRPQKRGPQLAPALPRRKIVRRARISPGDRVSLIERMMRSSERQIAEIEKRIGTAQDKGEQDARMLALIARTMRELTALDAHNRDLMPQPAAEMDNDDNPPDDIDEFRNELARRLNELVARRHDAGSAGGDKT
jgi:hypothetical protein